MLGRNEERRLPYLIIDNLRETNRYRMIKRSHVKFF